MGRGPAVDHAAKERVLSLFHCKYEGPDACKDGYQECDGAEFTEETLFQSYVRKHWIDATPSTKATYTSGLLQWERFIQQRRAEGQQEDGCAYPDAKVVQFLRWRLQELVANGSKNPAGTLGNHLNALRRLRKVQRGLPCRSFSEGGKALLQLALGEGVQATKRARQETASSPTKDLINSQHLTNDELCALVDYCYRRGDQEGLQVAAMVLMGTYGALRSNDICQLRWNLAASSTWDAAPVKMQLLHTGQRGGKTNVHGSGIELQSVRPCSRSKVITVDQDTGEVGKEPFSTLARTRSGRATGFDAWSDGFRNAVFFGWQAVPLATGAVQLGDELLVVETGAGQPLVPWRRLLLRACSLSSARSSELESHLELWLTGRGRMPAGWPPQPGPQQGVAGALMEGSNHGG